MITSDGASKVALERSIYNLIPIDAMATERVIKEAKQTLDRMGVIFFLRSWGN